MSYSNSDPVGATDESKAARLAKTTRPAMVRVSGKARPTDEQKQTYLDGLRSGRSIPSILRDNPDLPGLSMFSAERELDPAFDAAVVAARADGVTVNIDEALDYQYAVRTDKGLSIAASKYTHAVMHMAPLMAPKQFGQLVKLAGADGEKLSIALVAYSPQQQLQQTDEKPVQLLPATNVGPDVRGAPNGDANQSESP